MSSHTTMKSNDGVNVRRVVETPNPNARLLEQILSRENMQNAWKRVKANKGAPGIDKMPIEKFPDFARDKWDRIRESLSDGSYQPLPVKRVEIAKPGGGKRPLGIPTVTDRLIQQAIAQIMMPIFDPGFSDASYGFRPARSAHGAIYKVRDYIKEGFRVAVDMDLSKFFDKVNHDVLMHRVARKIKDKRVLKLIGKYLRAGVVVNGRRHKSRKGVPQGGPLSPLLANILLDDLDKELEKRGHRFVRYADDFLILVRSHQAGVRVSRSIERFVNRSWMGYYGISEYYRPIPEIDSWLRRRVCMCYWKQWRYVRTRVRNLLKMGTHRNVAIPMSFSRKGPWKCARTLATQTGMTNQWLKAQGLLVVKELWVNIHYPTKVR